MFAGDNLFAHASFYSLDLRSGLPQHRDFGGAASTVLQLGDLLSHCWGLTIGNSLVSPYLDLA